MGETFVKYIDYARRCWRLSVTGRRFNSGRLHSTRGRENNRGRSLMAGHSPCQDGRGCPGRESNVPSERSESRGPLAWFVYILRCSDGSYYVGHTEDVPARVERHQSGTGAAWTATRRPVSLALEEEHPSEATAVARERQIKRWSRHKKEALISGRLTDLKTLSRCRGLHG